jgi:hypothetical protein
MQADITVERNLKLHLRSIATGDSTSVRLTRINAQRLARALDAYARGDRAFDRSTTLEAAGLTSRSDDLALSILLREI